MVHQEKLSSLEKLSCRSCRNISESVFSCFFSFKNILKLDIFNTNFTGEGLSAVKEELSNLQDICLRGCNNLTDEGLKQVFRLTRNSLQNLNIAYTNVTGEGLAGFNITLPKLERLDFRSRSDNITARGYRQLRRICGDKLRMSEEQN